MDEANMSHYKALLRTIKYSIYTKDYCYQIKPDGNINGPWELRGCSDANYAGDNDTQKIVIGYIVLINGAFIAWCSLSHKTVTLFVTEPEYSEITEVCCEILFICVILWFMGVVVEYPIIMHVDKVRAIFLS